MPNLLFVSIAFPPKNDPECVQAGRYFKYLKNTGKFQIDLITSGRPTLFMPEDSSLNRYFKGFRQLIEIPLYESRLVNYALRFFRLGFVQFPDSKFLFHLQWKKTVRQLKAPPSIIYSRSNPISSAFMALKLKKHYRVPWVMHLSDPWSLSPLEEGDPKFLRRKKDNEKLLISKADAVTFTSVQTKDLYSREYPTFNEKFYVLPNVYDPEDMRPELFPYPEKLNWGLPDKLRVIYTGGLAGRRNVFFLKDVLNRLAAKTPDLPDRLEFIFAGDMDHGNKLFFESCHPSIRHIGMLQYKDVARLCAEAHLLLVVDYPTTGSGAVFFLAKLLDYILARRVIWAVTPEESTVREVLKNYPATFHTPSSVEEMAIFLEESMSRLKNKGADQFQVDRVPSDYDASIHAQSLSHLLDGMLNSGMIHKSNLEQIL